MHRSSCQSQSAAKRNNVVHREKPPVLLFLHLLVWKYHKNCCFCCTRQASSHCLQLVQLLLPVPLVFSRQLGPVTSQAQSPLQAEKQPRTAEHFPLSSIMQFPQHASRHFRSAPLLPVSVSPTDQITPKQEVKRTQHPVNVKTRHNPLAFNFIATYFSISWTKRRTRINMKRGNSKAASN